MASDTLAVRQQSLPPALEEPTASNTPVGLAIVNEASSSDAAARARSASIEPEALTPRATTPAPQPRSETKSGSVEPTSSSQVR
jgi:hypothetical protein